jgi:hypothetical protein
MGEVRSAIFINLLLFYSYTYQFNEDLNKISLPLSLSYTTSIGPRPVRGPTSYIPNKPFNTPNNPTTDSCD